MPRPLRPFNPNAVRNARRAVDLIRDARDALIAAGADRAVNATRRALASAEGAARYAEGRALREAKES
jgi:hypothetical protein